MKKKQKKLIYKIIIGVIVVLLLVVTNRYKKYLFVTNFLKDIFYFPVTFIHRDDVIGSNINVELEKEINELKDLLEMNNLLYEFDVINATIVNRNMASWLNVLTINKGKKDGLNIGMAVVSSRGLLGVIESVSYHTSLVRLITNRTNLNKVSVKVNERYKILETDIENNLVIKGIVDTDNIKVGDLVVTSGLSDLFPSGITIGTISKIEKDYYDISKKAYVNYDKTINEVIYVSVLKRKVDYE